LLKINDIEINEILLNRTHFALDNEAKWNIVDIFINNLDAPFFVIAVFKKVWSITFCTTKFQGQAITQKKRKCVLIKFSYETVFFLTF
jgi:hypothetical protein